MRADEDYLAIPWLVKPCAKTILYGKIFKLKF